MARRAAARAVARRGGGVMAWEVPVVLRLVNEPYRMLARLFSRWAMCAVAVSR